MSEKPHILVLCTGNSCRSQMAEGFLRALAGDRFDVHSAGTAPKTEVHPLACEVMDEAGIDISGQFPKDLQQFLGKMRIRFLIVVCDGAQASCPRIFPGMQERLYWPFEDPAAFVGTPDETRAAFRRIRDEIRSHIETWLTEFSG